MVKPINLNKTLVTKALLLNYIQDIDVYRFYTTQEVELKKPIISPLRPKEDNASFGYFEGEYGEICFKDFVLGSGDFVKFVQLKFGLNFFEALSKIVIDFNLHHYFYYKEVKKSNITYDSSKFNDKSDILEKASNYRLGKTKRDWQAYDLAFWQQFGISLNILKKYRVQPISFIYINGNPIAADKYAYCFIEQKDGKETYKIYQPFNKNYKWLNNHNASVWQGWEQLPALGGELIITKSLKDVMSIKSLLNISSVSLQAEGTNPKPHIIEELKERFKTIYVLYDNDYDKEQNWGQLFGNEIADKYNLINLCIPKEFKSKDFSDLVKNIDDIDTDTFSTGKKQTIKDKVKLIWQCNIQLPF